MTKFLSSGHYWHISISLLLQCHGLCALPEKSASSASGLSSASFPKCSQDSLLPGQCEVRECLQPYSPTTASNGAILPTVGDCLELRNQLTTDAYPLTLPLNSRQATLVLRQLSSFISLSYLLVMGKNPTFQEFRPAVF